MQISYENLACKQYDHSKYMSFAHSTCMYYGRNTCMIFDHATYMIFYVGGNRYDTQYTCTCYDTVHAITITSHALTMINILAFAIVAVL